MTTSWSSQISVIKVSLTCAESIKPTDEDDLPPDIDECQNWFVTNAIILTGGKLKIESIN